MIPSEVHEALSRLVLLVQGSENEPYYYDDISLVQGWLDAQQAQERWEPVSVATYSTEDATLAVADNELSVITETGGDYLIIEWTLPKNMCLCRRIEPQQPQEDTDDGN